MLRLLDVHPGQHVLDVGSGSAWTTALLAHLVGHEGEVVGVEIVPGLVELGRAQPGPLQRAGTGRAGRRGGARAPRRGAVRPDPGLRGGDPAPDTLVDQLVVGGVLVVPVAGWMHEVRRTGGEPDDVRHGPYAFVPLVGG